MRKLLFLALGGLLLALAAWGTADWNPDTGLWRKRTADVRRFRRTGDAGLTRRKASGIHFTCSPLQRLRWNADPASLPGAIRGATVVYKCRSSRPVLRRLHVSAVMFVPRGLRLVYLIAMAVLAAGTADPALVRDNDHL
jgi:hypothetical protein